MANVLLQPVKNVVQLQYPAPLDRRNPLTRGLSFVSQPGTKRDQISKTFATATGSKVISNKTTAYAHTGSATIPNYGNLPGSNLTNPEFTVMVILDSATASGYRGIFSKWDALGNANAWAMGIEGGGGQLEFVSFDNVGASNSQLYGVANGTARLNASFAVTSNASGSAAYQDGVLLGTSTSFGTLTAGTGALRIGVYRFDAPTENFLGNYKLAVIWQRALTAAEIASFYKNPWQIFKAPDKQIWTSAAGGVTTSLAKTDTKDTSAIAITVGVGTSLNKTEQHDSAALAGSTTITSSLAKTNNNDTAALAGSTTIVTSLAKTNANDTSVINVFPGRTTSIGVTEGHDTLVATAGSFVATSLAKTEQPDTMVAAGSITIVTSVTKTNVNDTMVAAGNSTIITTLAKTNANDTMVASGGPSGFTSSSLNTTNQNDTMVASGTITTLSSITVTNRNDTMASAGSTTITATLIKTNNNDSLSAFISNGGGGASTLVWNKLTVSRRNSL